MSLLSTLFDTGEITDEDFLPAIKGNNQRYQGKLGRIVAAYGVARFAYSYGKKAQAYWEAKNRISVTIESTDSFYDSARLWVSTLVPIEKTQNIIINSGNAGYWDDYGDFAIDKTSGLSISHDSKQTHKITVDGFDVSVVLKKPDQLQAFQSTGMVDMKSSTSYSTDKIVFTMSSVEAKEALVSNLEHVYKESLKKAPAKPRLFNGTSTHFRGGIPLPNRPVESVVLKDGQLERILEDFKKFLDEENDYMRLGIPYHRGYLFYGPPGTGKTSLAKVISSYFNLNIYYVSLGDIQTDGDLVMLLGNIAENSVLLLEDVDVFRSTEVRREGNKKEKDGKGLSLSGLMNILDGVGTPHGLVSILTTNYKDELDDALIRKGRVDLTEELTYLDYSQGQRLYEFAYGVPASKDMDLTGVSPAEVIEVFKQNMHSAQGALEALLTRKPVMNGPVARI